MVIQASSIVTVKARDLTIARRALTVLLSCCDPNYVESSVVFHVAFHADCAPILRQLAYALDGMDASAQSSDPRRI